jgi:hypothetical protein
MLVVTVPVDLASVFPQLAGDATVSAFASFAAIVMNVSIIWAILRRQETGQVPRLAAAYYDSSVALVRFLLVTLALVVMLFPAGLGASLYSAALSAAGSTGVSIVELLLVGLVAFILSTPSIYLMTRYGLAPLLTIRDGLRPVAALRLSRRLTLGRFWRVLGRYFMLGIFVVLLSIPATILTVIFSLLKLTTVATFVFEAVTTILVLPVTNLYLVHLVQSLQENMARD